MRKQQIEFLKELRERIEKDCEGYFPELDEMGELKRFLSPKTAKKAKAEAKRFDRWGAGI